MRSNNNLMASKRTERRSTGSHKKTSAVLSILVMLVVMICRVKSEKTTEEVCIENSEIIRTRARRHSDMCKEVHSIFKTDRMYVVDVELFPTGTQWERGYGVVLTLAPLKNMSCNAVPMKEKEWRNKIDRLTREYHTSKIKVKVQHRNISENAIEHECDDEHEHKNSGEWITGQKRGQGDQNSRACSVHEVLEYTIECLYNHKHAIHRKGWEYVITFDIEYALLYYTDMPEVVKMIKEKSTKKYKVVNINYSSSYNLLYREDTEEMCEYTEYIPMTNERAVVLEDRVYTILKYSGGRYAFSHWYTDQYDESGVTEKCTKTVIMIDASREDEMLYTEIEGNVKHSIMQWNLEDVYGMADMENSETFGEIALHMYIQEDEDEYNYKCKTKCIVNTFVPDGRELRIGEMRIYAGCITNVVVENKSQPEKFYMPILVEKHANKRFHRVYTEPAYTETWYNKHEHRGRSFRAGTSLPGMLYVEEMHLTLGEPAVDVEVKHSEYMEIQRVWIFDTACLYRNNRTKYHSTLLPVINSIACKKAIHMHMSYQDYARCVMREPYLIGRQALPRVSEEVMKLTGKSEDEVRRMLNSGYIEVEIRDDQQC